MTGFANSSLHRTVFLSVLAAAALVAPTAGQAQVLTSLNPDNKVVPGASCQPTNTAELSNFAVRASGIRNVSTINRWVTCGITTDSEAPWSSYSVPLLVTGHADILVTLDNSTVTTASQTTCVAQVISAGVSIESLSGTAPNTPGTTSQVALTGMSTGSARESQPLAVSCQLPPGVNLTSLRVEETTLTDVNLLGTLGGIL